MVLVLGVGGCLGFRISVASVAMSVALTCMLFFKISRSFADLMIPILKLEAPKPLNSTPRYPKHQK